jgi:hypothetical protein
VLLCIAPFCLPFCCIQWLLYRLHLCTPWGLPFFAHFTTMSKGLSWYVLSNLFLLV